MSSSAGYYVSPADLAARRRRELRGEIAALRTRLSRLDRRARALGAGAGRVSAGNDTSTDNSVLEATVADLHTAIAETQERISDNWTSRWQAEIAATTAAERTTTRSAADELRESRHREHAEGTAVLAQRRRRAVDDVSRLLRSAGTRCDPADLEVLTGRFTAMSTVDSVDAVRAAALDLSVAVHDAVARQKSRDAGDELRSRLLGLLEDALPEDRERLRPALESAADCRDWQDSVHQAVERADLRLHRDRVATAVAEALTDAGCALGENFTSVLLADGQAVVGLGEPDEDYGLLVRLPGDGGQLLTSVVRADDVPPDPGQDLAAQRGFCDRTLPAITASLGERITVDPHPFLEIEPGRLAVAPVPLHHVRRRLTRPNRPAAQQVLRERRT
jgi:hypothetical protein